mgnify:CR=1 FL=1
MGIFDKFNKNVDKAEVRKQVEQASNETTYKEVPVGFYTGEIEKMELAATKDGRPMFKVQFRIKEGAFKKHCVFMNRVVAGTKNDMSMIASVEGWVNKLEPETPLEFDGNYNNFAEDIMDIAEEICGNVMCDIEYDPDAFNSITIKDVWDE